MMEPHSDLHDQSIHVPPPPPLPEVQLTLAPPAGGPPDVVGPKPIPTFGTQDKFEIVDLVFRAYTIPAPPHKTLKCSDFYPLYFAATPPAVWLNIAWIGRRIHRSNETIDPRTSPLSHLQQLSPHHGVDPTTSVDPVAVSVDLSQHQTGRKRKRSDPSGKRGKMKREIVGVQLIDGLNLAVLSKEALSLKHLCDEHNVPFIMSPNEDRVQQARSVIDLYYSVMKAGMRKVCSETSLYHYLLSPPFLFAREK